MILRRLKYTLFVISSLFLKFNVDAQELSVQLNAGLMNYGGDLKTTFFTLDQSKFTAGANILFSVNRFVLRAGFAYGSIQANDKFATRNLNFKSTITDFNFCLEYDFLSAEKDRKIIPYVFAGIGLYHYNPYTIYNSNKVYLRPLGTEGEGLQIYPDRKVYPLTTFEDPFGFGVKYKISSNVLIGLEFNSRFLYTDYLDDVSRKYPDPNELFKAHGQLAVDLSFRGDEINPALGFPEGKIRGNPHQNDNYYTSVITLTYIFPERSSFGNSSGHNRHSLSCPKKVH